MSITFSVYRLRDVTTGRTLPFNVHVSRLKPLITAVDTSAKPSVPCKLHQQQLIKLGKRCKVADFEKVPTGYERWPAQWPKVRLRHGPIARLHGGVARSFRWGTVSNAFVLSSPCPRGMSRRNSPFAFTMRKCYMYISRRPL